MKAYLGVVGACIVWVVALNAYGETRYVITPIGTADIPAQDAWGINDSGVVVGGGFLLDGNGLRKLSWTDDGGVGAVLARGINDHAQIVGSMGILGMRSRTAFLSENGEIRGLSPLVGDWTWAMDINDAGVIVGYREPSPLDYGVWYSFVLDREEFTRLDPPPGGQSHALAINNQGLVVGWQGPRYGHGRAFLYDSSAKGMTDLGALGGEYSYATDVNDVGQVVGRAATANGEFHAFLWEAGEMTDLGTLGGSWSRAEAINDHGWIVGRSDRGPFLYDGSSITDLDRLIVNTGTWKGIVPYAINNAGQIVGHGTFGEDSCAFLLTPVVLPEPTTLASLLVTTSAMLMLTLLRTRLRKMQAQRCL